MKRLSRVLRQTLLTRGAALVAFASTVVCAAPPAELLDQTHHGVKAAMALQSAITPDLMKRPEVLGSAVGLNEAGQLALVVFVDRDGAFPQGRYPGTAPRAWRHPGAR